MPTPEEQLQILMDAQQKEEQRIRITREQGAAAAEALAYGKAATANTRIPTWAELTGLRPWASPPQRGSHGSNRTRRTRAIVTPLTGYASRSC